MKGKEEKQKRKRKKPNLYGPNSPRKRATEMESIEEAEDEDYYPKPRRKN